MKIRVLNGILLIDILSILLFASITFIPTTIARVILGIPFLFFFPGYTLIAAMFVTGARITSIQRLALSFGMSIAMVGLVGFALNYAPWGIRLEPVLYTLFILVVVFSVIALIRGGRSHGSGSFNTERKLNLPGWEGSKINKSFSIIMIIAIVSAFGVLGYTVAAPKTGEKFTEFYMMGLNGQAQDYPAEFVMQNGKVAQVVYNTGTVNTTDGMGKVFLTVVNHEQQPANYVVRMTIDGQPANIESVGKAVPELGPISLDRQEKWEQEIGIIPQHIGNNQKIELSLFKDSDTVAEDTLHLWVNVR